MSPSFRLTTEADVAPLLAIYNHYVLHSTATFHAEPLDAAAFRGLLFPSYPRFDSWVIEADGVPAGYVILSRYKPREAYDGTAEVTVYLAPDQGGRGLGSAALAFVEERARERRFHSLLAIICAENSASLRLFAKHGFTNCARYREVGRKFDRWLDVVSYEKLLT